ncbi:wsv201 [White spot syndrome virus]|uniref:Wsv201 n=4 Tax=White spot syndrome virus TaxID=342409 RepID=Q8VB09_WSSVS|nr:wsv201 [Shrimp white spot syndrome virus]AFX59578.1 wsv201 [White spot syndrome virus]AAL33205.1 wsv201 [Shrimp white spot syndrome virus]AAL89124.1 WSSV256 [Shrimp white spot syndrome virus]AWQ60375.1 wsv201 [Shrimp white spot syndrome virus]AWQ60788.1 wsv201 [Shrimp white spot syndrome virus]
MNSGLAPFIIRHKSVLHWYIIDVLARCMRGVKCLSLHVVFTNDFKIGCEISWLIKGYLCTIANVNRVCPFPPSSSSSSIQVFASQGNSSMKSEADCMAGKLCKSF